MSGTRWLGVVMAVGLAVLCGSGARDASAQVFRPRGAAKATQAGKISPPVAAKKPAAVTAAPAAALSKKPTRATGPTPRRVVSAAPGKKPRVAKAHRGDDDVMVEDDDVKISDD